MNLYVMDEPGCSGKGERFPGPRRGARLQSGDDGLAQKCMRGFPPERVCIRALLAGSGTAVHGWELEPPGQPAHQQGGCSKAKHAVLRVLASLPH